MKYFPLTETANLARGECGQSFDQWRTNLPFDNAQDCRREHIPEFTQLSRALLTIQGGPGVYTVEFPRKRWQV